MENRPFLATNLLAAVVFGNTIGNSVHLERRKFSDPYAVAVSFFVTTIGKSVHLENRRVSVPNLIFKKERPFEGQDVLGSKFSYRSFFLSIAIGKRQFGKQKVPDTIVGKSSNLDNRRFLVSIWKIGGPWFQNPALVMEKESITSYFHSQPQLDKASI